MYPVALEVGMDLTYPTELCIPEIGIEAGCRVLRRCFTQTAQRAGNTSAPKVEALLAYNGGGDAQYPDRVLAWRDDAMTSGLLREA